MIQTIDSGKCVGCGLCAAKCPLDVLRVRAGKAVIAYPDDCMTCYICERSCPQGAIFVHPFKEAAPPVLPGILEFLSTRDGRPS
ncbi:4Fe-4S dicluster domain-containing protein [Moorella sulfitireducens]|uniref:4Fe-4S dicluster domain-containing protein n=1 Tax=Neomoorella sulfitireducens TaxID=2972948 RepID=UPI0021AD33F1|nr:4Fe-4S binding protein [Moorella sulfitireducens]